MLGTMKKPLVFAALIALALAYRSLAFAADASEPPTMAKDTVFLKAVTNEFDLRGQPPDWLPALEFKVNGTIPDGSRLWAEISYPAKKNWLKGDCAFGTSFAGQTQYTCSFEKNKTRYTGTIDFVVHLSNELLGKEMELMRGKAKVGKTGPRVKGQPASYAYYVDDDWRVPIGYLSMGRTLAIEMYFRGKPGEVRPHLFSDGKPVAAPENCGAALFEPAAFEWWPVKCEFFSGTDAITTFKPGDYELKVLQNGKLVRIASFKVNPEGSYDNGIASASKAGIQRVVIPMKQLVDHVPWDKQAYKTAAFYGNPLLGFAVP
jgi:hypothetical protein